MARVATIAAVVVLAAMFYLVSMPLRAAEPRPVVLDRPVADAQSGAAVAIPYLERADRGRYLIRFRLSPTQVDEDGAYLVNAFLYRPESGARRGLDEHLGTVAFFPPPVANLEVPFAVSIPERVALSGSGPIYLRIELAPIEQGGTIGKSSVRLLDVNLIRSEGR